MSQYTLLRNIETELHFEDGYIILTTKTESGCIAFDIIEGNVMVNMTDFKTFCEREDVSLSESERSELLAYIECTIEPFVVEEVE
jgi:hypothetical protein